MLLYKSGIEKLESLAKPQQNPKMSFAKSTTYGLGGGAKLWFEPKSLYSAKRCYDFCKASGAPVFVLGNGSNVLASDKEFDGTVIRTKRLKGIVRQDDDSLFCLAGTTVSELLTYCRKNLLTGLEFLYGIPASVGGAAFMNAGVKGLAIGDNIRKVLLYDGKNVVLNNSQCNFGYRRSTMRDINAIILAIVVNTRSASLKEIEEKTRYFKERRKNLPRGRSCGCVFKNPQGISAGALIDNAGLKGLTVGGASVSSEHANFIINKGGSSSDVKSLIAIVKKRVFEKFGVELCEEVVYIGEFNDFNC